MTHIPGDPTALETSILDGIGDPGQAEGARLHRELLNALFVFMKNGLIFELNNPTLQQACARVASVFNAAREHNDGAASIAFLADGVYINRALLKLKGSGYAQGDYLFTIWQALGVSEIEAVHETQTEDWLRIIADVKRCLTSADKEARLDGSHYPSVRLVFVDSFAHSEDVTITNRLRALRSYAIAVIALEDLIHKVDKGKRLRAVEVKRPLQDLIGVARDCPELLMALLHLKRHKTSVAHHLVNSTVLTICMTRRFELTRAERSELAMVAILHCFGRAFVAPDGRESAHSLEHRYALESVKKLATTAAMNTRTLGRLVVANETRMWAFRRGDAENADYPFDTGTAARLVAVAHAYDLLTTPRPGAPALLPDEALRVLIAEAGRRYDETVVKLLVNELGVYPVGSVVALNDGRTAIVVDAPRDNAGPTRPRIKIIRDAHNRATDGAMLDLAGDAGADVHIVRCVDPEEAQINTPAFLLG